MNRHIALDTKESAIEKRLRLGVEKRGGKCLKFISPGFPGVFDRIVFMRRGWSYLVECKKPKGGVYSALQLNVHQMFTDLDYQIYRLHTNEQVDSFLHFIE